MKVPAPALPIEEFARSKAYPGRFAMPLTGLLIAAYVVSLVLFDQRPSTAFISLGLKMLLIVGFALEVLVKRNGLFFPGSLVWFALFLSYVTLQMVWAPGSSSMLLALVQVLIVSVIIISHDASIRKTTALEYALYVAIACTFLYNLYSGEAAPGGRIGSTLMNPNSYSEVLLLGWLLALRRVLIDNSRHILDAKRLVSFIAYFGLSLYGITYLAGSRKAMVLMVAATVVIMLYWVWQQPIRGRVVVSIVVAALLVAFVYVVYRSPQFQRLIALSDFLEGQGSADTSLTARSQMARDALNLWRQRPFTGWGLEQFRVLSRWAGYSHNNYVELLANNGLIGLFLYVMIYISTLASLARSFRRSGDPVLSAELFWGMTVIGIMLGWDFGAVSYYSKTQWILLSIVIAVSVRGRRRAQSDEMAVHTGRRYTATTFEG